MKYKLMSLFLIYTNFVLGQEMVLVPFDGETYKKIPLSNIIKNDDKLKNIKLEEQKEKYKKVNQEIEILTNKDFIIEEPFSLEDLLKISFNYEKRKIDNDSLKNNKNPLQNKIIEDFISNSKIDQRISENMYFFNISFFGNKSKFEDIKEKIENENLKNNGLVVSVQYGINNDINIKFNGGYSQSKFLEEKSNNLYFSLDYNYSPYYYNDWQWEIGATLGYLNGKNDYYKTEDMFIGLIYTNLSIPFTETIYMDGEFESTIISNKLGVGVRKEIYYFDNLDIDLGLMSDFVFGYRDKDKSIYTHLDEKEATIKLEMKISGTTNDGAFLNSFYDFQYKSYGIKMEYIF